MRVLVLLLCLSSLPATAQTTLYTGPNSGGNSDTWNIPGNWNNGVPSGAINAEVPAGITVTADDGALPAYTGSLTLNANSILRIEWLGSDTSLYRAWGTTGSTVITAFDGTLLNCRAGGATAIPELNLQGELTIVHSQSTQGAIDISYNHPVTGPGTLNLQGKGGSDAYLNASNSVAEIKISEQGSGAIGMVVHANAAGCLGQGDVTIEDNSGGIGSPSGSLILNVPNTIADTATLWVQGQLSETVLTLNADETVNQLKGGLMTFPAGTYGGPASAAATKLTWIGGTGILTVLSGEGFGGLRGPLKVWKSYANGGINPVTGTNWAKGDTFRLAFVTSGTTPASNTNISFYNDFAQAAAASSSLHPGLGGTTWSVIGSSPAMSAKDNTMSNPSSNGVGVAIFLIDGQTRVANNYNDLWDGGIDTPLIMDENGNDHSSQVHTGSDAGGNKSGTRTFGGDSGGAITIGESFDNSGHWMIQFNTPATSLRPVYAMSGLLTISYAQGTLIQLK